MSLAPRALIVLGLVLSLVGCASAPPASDFILAGNRGPTVVMQAGFGEGKAVWHAVIDELTRDHTVFAYDRPGTAGQPDTDAPRDPCSIADEQCTRLRAVGLKPPYILVGHSLGGLYLYVYAKRYPEDVAGIVLLDPTHPRNWETLERTQPSAALMIRAMKSVAFKPMQQREFDAQTVCLDRLGMDSPLQMPGALLISGRPDQIASAEYEQARLQLAQDWLRLTGVDRLERVWESGHHIQTEAPLTVAAAVRRLSRQADSAQVAPAEQTLAFGKRPALHFAAGITTRAEVVRAWGEPDETRHDGDTTIAVYRDAPLKVPLALSLIPIVGDIADAIGVADGARERQEAIIRFDARDTAQRWNLRSIR